MGKWNTLLNFLYYVLYNVVNNKLRNSKYSNLKTIMMNLRQFIMDCENSSLSTSLKIPRQIIPGHVVQVRTNHGSRLTGVRGAFATSLMSRCVL